jgi:hypothetical protein
MEIRIVVEAELKAGLPLKLVSEPKPTVHSSLFSFRRPQCVSLRSD